MLNQVSKNWDLIFLLFNPWLGSLLIKDVFHIELGHFLRFRPLVAEKFLSFVSPLSHGQWVVTSSCDFNSYFLETNEVSASHKCIDYFDI